MALRFSSSNTHSRLLLPLFSFLSSRLDSLVFASSSSSSSSSSSLLVSGPQIAMTTGERTSVQKKKHTHTHTHHTHSEFSGSNTIPQIDASNSERNFVAHFFSSHTILYPLVGSGSLHTYPTGTHTYTHPHTQTHTHTHTRTHTPQYHQTRNEAGKLLAIILRNLWIPTPFYGVCVYVCVCVGDNFAQLVDSYSVLWCVWEGCVGVRVCVGDNFCTTCGFLLHFMVSE